jgi:uncharacterized protein (DUF58 family)
MSAPPVSATATATLRPTLDGRLLPYGALTILAMAAAIVFGEPHLVALAAPFAVAIALGLDRTHPVEVVARFELFSDRVLEGDTLEGRLELSWEGEFDAEVLIHRLRGVKAASPEATTAHEAGTRRIELPVQLVATRWGRHSIGEVWLRLTRPFGLMSWTGRVMEAPHARVLPGTERLRQLLSPTRSRTVWGAHRSSRLGDGHDFAELRPYTPGDRLRDLNWAATGRYGRPIVNRHLPEVSGDVVIALDAFDDGSVTSREVLAKTARVAWALASFHLRANDRVGLVGIAAGTQWMPPAGGRLAQYKLMDTLLQVGGEAVDRVSVTPRWVDVPPAALVIAVSTLHAERSMMTLMSWRARGQSVAVVMIDPASMWDPPESVPGQLANRLWHLELERRTAELRRAGIAVVRAPVDGAIGPVLSALRRARRAPARRRA